MSTSTGVGLFLSIKQCAADQQMRQTGPLLLWCWTGILKKKKKKWGSESRYCVCIYSVEAHVVVVGGRGANLKEIVPFTYLNALNG